MTIKIPSTGPTRERAAEWWVLLNCDVWPSDMGHPLPPFYDEDQRHATIHGAFLALDASGLVDEDLVNEIWSDHQRRKALVYGGQS